MNIKRKNYYHKLSTYYCVCWLSALMLRNLLVKWGEIALPTETLSVCAGLILLGFF